MGLLVAAGLLCFFLYNQNQTLTENHIKLEAAVVEQQQTMAIMKESYEKQGESLMNMSREMALIEKEKAEYLAIFSRHNVDLLATKKPGLIENRFNNGSVEVMEGIEDDTEKLFNLGNPDNND